MLAFFKLASDKFTVQQLESLIVSFVYKPHRAHPIVRGGHNSLTQRRFHKSIYNGVHPFDVFHCKNSQKIFLKKIFQKIWFIKQTLLPLLPMRAESRDRSFFKTKWFIK